jgi:hypothetical protein
MILFPTVAIHGNREEYGPVNFTLPCKKDWIFERMNHYGKVYSGRDFVEYPVPTHRSRTSTQTKVRVFSPKKKSMNEHVLHLLKTLPTPHNKHRLFVGSDGLLYVDYTYDYLGRFGRAFLDRVVGGYSREAILLHLESLMSLLQVRVHQMVQTLSSPYFRGNLKTYGWCPEAETRLLADVLRVQENFPKLRTLLTALWEAYDDDICVLGRLTRLRHGQTEMEKTLIPSIQMARQYVTRPGVVSVARSTSPSSADGSRDDPSDQTKTQ